MINDTDIDLTIAQKFSRPHWYRTKADKAYDKLFRKNEHSDLFYKYCKRSSELPWNKRKLNSVEQLRQKRAYDDWLSDDFGVTLRITEDNTIMYFGERNIPKFILEEYFLETLGYLPYESIKLCMECQYKSIHSLKNRNSFGLCKFHITPKLPWINTRRTIEL